MKQSRGTHTPVGLRESSQIELFISSSTGYTTNNFDVREVHIYCNCDFITHNMFYIHGLINGRVETVATDCKYQMFSIQTF